jgi:glutathione S-transferase
MKLYSLPLSPYAARVRGAIYAKKLPVEIVLPPSDWRTSTTYRALNPLVRIPVLVLDNGTSIPESGVIVDYLEETHPNPPLLPETAEERAQVRVIVSVADHYVMQEIMPLFFLLDTQDRDDSEIETSFAKLAKGLGHLDRLIDANSYATGGRLTAADIWLTPVRFTLDGLMGFSGRTTLLDDYKAVAGYAKVAQRDPALGRVWQEMTDGLAAMMKSRKA